MGKPDQKYFVFTDRQGEHYLCPYASIGNREAVTDHELLDCVEKDVTERYSGNIIIEDKN